MAKLRVIIPLAAPRDEFMSHFGVPKPRAPVKWSNETPLMRFCLESRGYPPDTAFYVAVRPEIYEEYWGKAVAEDILELFPDGCASIHLVKDETCGAADTVRWTIQQVQSLLDSDDAVVVDLCDLTFKPRTACWYDTRSYGQEFNSLLTIFPSALAKYSYAVPPEGVCEPMPDYWEAVKTVEKQVVSSWASAGVYCFKNARVLDDAVKNHMLDYHNKVKGMFFMCPALNEAKPIAAVHVDDVFDLGTPDHLINKELSFRTSSVAD